MGSGLSRLGRRAIAAGIRRIFRLHCQRLAHNYYPAYLWHNDQKVALDGQTYSHDLIFHQALKFIRAHHRQPFFCYLPVAIPHAAMQIPDYLALPFRRQKEDPNAPIQLFDLQTDLSETRDVATFHLEIVRRTHSTFQAARTESQLFGLFEYGNDFVV